MKWADVDCFGNYKTQTLNCYNVYETGQCCPKEVCISEGQVEHKCNYRDNWYRLGQKFRTIEDNCMECTCDDMWNNQTDPKSSNSCKKIDCDLESNNKFKAGCLPIYHEKTCCPIDFHCRKYWLKMKYFYKILFEILNSIDSSTRRTSLCLRWSQIQNRRDFKHQETLCKNADIGCAQRLYQTIPNHSSDWSKEQFDWMVR